MKYLAILAFVICAFTVQGQQMTQENAIKNRIVQMRDVSSIFQSELQLLDPVVKELQETKEAIKNKKGKKEIDKRLIAKEAVQLFLQKKLEMINEQLKSLIEQYTALQNKENKETETSKE